MKKVYASIFGILCIISSVIAASVTLQWDPNCEPDVTGYRVYYGTNSTTVTNVSPAYTDYCGTNHPAATNIYHTPYTMSVPSAGGRTNVSVRITNLVAGLTYSFVVVATNDVGLESDYSNEARYTIPVVVPPQPPVLRFNP